LALSVIYNIVAIPVAFAGWVIPLVAALSMSLSSLLVVLNSLRMNYQK
jgi:Cu+-exporting ATPase